MTSAAIVPGCALPPARRRFHWGYLLLALLAVFALVMATGVLAVVLSFRMSDDSRALRQTVFAAAPGQWDRQFELGVGRIPVALARAGALRFIPDLDPIARAGIRSLERGDVGVYRRVTGPSSMGLSDGTLGKARETMARRGWEPLVMVQDGDQSVAVFLPSGTSHADRLDVCVLVVDHEQLVLVSGSIQTAPLFEVLLPKIQEALAEASEACASFRIPGLR
jgi:hypothetical protein